MRKMPSRLFSGSDRMAFVWKNAEAATLYSIANSVYILENKIKNEETFPKSLIVDVYIDMGKNTADLVKKMLNILIQDVLCEDIQFILNKKALPNVKGDRKFDSCETICLFSGGIDSSIGILESLAKFKKIIGLYVAHRYTGKIDNKVENLNKLLLKPSNINLEKFMAPEWRRGYSQTRGFVYILYAGILSLLSDAKRVIVSECGQTMFQPKFAPLDTITYTTHPYVLQIAKTIIKFIIGRDIQIIIPFEDFTKSELIQVRPDDSLLSKTHSCITGRWKGNCGKCYACITRMIGSVNNGLSLSYFKDNVFAIPDDEDLNALLNFCFNFVYNPKDLDFWSFRSIEHFGKSELFERVSAEAFLALSILRDKGILHANYEFILDEYEELRINKRKEELKKSKQPDFSKEVSLYKIT
ncbi:7-cyano-7-deazaguanine synthase [Candidatus Woesearchaeota archaeon]|nr:7-cyano-7-deazaguanine synthase [Candidatus Woesearchaeota archaeon]